MAKDFVSVVVPVYNEEKSAEKTFSQIKTAMDESGMDYEVIAVNDGSTDFTPGILKEVEGVRVINNWKNMGYGFSLRRGIYAAKGEKIAIADADGSYPYAQIPGLAKMLEGDVDMVVGWRQSKKEKISLIRRTAKGIIRRLAENLAGYKIQDINSGLRVFRRSYILANKNLFPSGFSFTSTLTLLIASGRGRIIYQPIEYFAREGKSKFHPIHDTWAMITLIVRAVMLFDPLRVFIPLMFLSFLGALYFQVLSWIGPAVYRASVTIMVAIGLQMLGLGLLADQINRRSKE